MRRLRIGVLASVLIVSTLLVGSATADHVFFVPDAKDCAQMPAPGGSVTDPDQPDRGMACVSDGNAANGPELYVGGEASAETPYPDDPMAQPGDACGAVVVGGQVGSASRPDDPATPENESLDWDWMHTHADNTVHHHTCD